VTKKRRTNRNNDTVTQNTRREYFIRNKGCTVLLVVYTVLYINAHIINIFHEVVCRCWVWFEIECILYGCGIYTCFSQ